MARPMIRRGTVLLEFGLALPVLLLLVTGMIVFGQLLNAWLLISNASREGARAGVVGQTNTSIEAAVRERTAPLIQDNLEVIITPASQSARVLGGPLKVEVRYSMPIALPLYDLLLPDPFPLHAATVMRDESGPIT